MKINQNSSIRSEEEDKNETEHNTTFTEEDYLAHTINTNAQESVWSPDRNKTIVDARRRKSTDINGCEEFVEYQRVLVGYCVQVKSLDDFYFRVQDAEQQLKSIKPQESDLVRLDSNPRKGELCWSKVDEKLYRAQIIDFDPIKEQVDALHVDYGVNTR